MTCGSGLASARREQPQAVVGVLGPRPSYGHDASRWDVVAGRLSQHQAAFNIDDGLGSYPGYYTRSAYRDSHQAIADLLQPVERPVMDRSIEPPDLGLSVW